MPDYELITKPADLVHIDIYRDGGTIALVLQDTGERALTFSVDGSFGSPTAGRIYLDVRSEKGRSSEFVPKGDRRESYILELLEDWLNRTFTAEELKDLQGSYGQRHLSELERRGALCISAVDSIKR